MMQVVRMSQSTRRSLRILLSTDHYFTIALRGRPRQISLEVGGLDLHLHRSIYLSPSSVLAFLFKGLRSYINMLIWVVSLRPAKFRTSRHFGMLNYQCHELFEQDRNR